MGNNCTYKGFDEKRKIISKLESHWPDTQMGKIPTVAQLLAQFTPDQQVSRTSAKESMHSLRRSNNEPCNEKETETNKQNLGFMVRTAYRSGPSKQWEIQLLRLIDTEFDKESMGLAPGTSKIVVLRTAVNRCFSSLRSILIKFPKEFKERSSKGLVRESYVTNMLEKAWPEHQRGNIPTIAQLFEFFAAGRDLIKTFATGPPHGYSVSTAPITDIPVEGIRPLIICRVSREDQFRDGNSIPVQKIMSSGNLFKYKDCARISIPVGGILCISEVKSAWSSPSHALLHALNDPILSRLDTNGQCIAFNTVVFCYGDRVSRCLATYDIIEAALSKRGVNIWCLHEGIGVRTHRDDFRRMIQRAEDFSNLLSTRVKNGYAVKGLRNCSPHEPSAKGDGWGPKEDIRLIQFIGPHDNVPLKYIRAAKGRARRQIKWTYLASEEFAPFRTGQELIDRARSLARHGLRKD
jgi:hypothetical protein